MFKISYLYSLCATVFMVSGGAAVLGAHFGAPFPAYGGGPPPPPPHTPLLATPRAHHHPHHGHHHSHPHHPASFYPPPLVYWPYPSPPVSPTTYFSQPGAHSPSQPLYPLDFFPPSPLSPPGVAIPHTTAGLILTPTKATVSFVPGAKQFPGSSAGSNSSSSSSSSSSKLSVPAIAVNGTSSDGATPTPETGATPTGSAQEAVPATSPQTLLSIDTNHAAAAAAAAPPLKTGSQGAGGVSAATPLVSNPCVELYIS